MTRLRTYRGSVTASPVTIITARTPQRFKGMQWCNSNAAARTLSVTITTVEGTAVQFIDKSVDPDARLDDDTTGHLLPGESITVSASNTGITYHIETEVVE